jgi:hypothetical protein
MRRRREFRMHSVPVKLPQSGDCGTIALHGVQIQTQLDFLFSTALHILQRRSWKRKPLLSRELSGRSIEGTAQSISGKLLKVVSCNRDFSLRPFPLRAIQVMCHNRQRAFGLPNCLAASRTMKHFTTGVKTERV